MPAGSERVRIVEAMLSATTPKEGPLTGVVRAWARRGATAWAAESVLPSTSDRISR
jgi:hypothetical protein